MVEFPQALLMNVDLEKLKELQAVEREIARLGAEVAALPKRVASLEAQLADTKLKVERAQSAISANLNDRRKQEQKIQDEQQKISKYREQSLGVKTNEQYRALMHEVQFAEQEIRACEDRILEGMVNNEELEKKLKRAEAELKAETVQIEKEKAEARAVTAKDEAELADWNLKRKTLRMAISPDHLAYYDRVAAVRKNALAEARDHKCSACQVMLRPQTYNEVRTNEHIIACDSCQRILFYEPAQEAEADEVAMRKGSKKSGAVDRAWYYHSDSPYGVIFVVYVNAKGSCSKRVYDADDGRRIDAKEIHEDCSFAEVFADELRHAKRVHVEVPPNLEEDCREQLPPDLLANLQRQVAEPEQAETPATQ